MFSGWPTSSRKSKLLHALDYSNVTVYAAKAMPHKFGFCLAQAKFALFVAISMLVGAVWAAPSLADGDSTVASRDSVVVSRISDSNVLVLSVGDKRAESFEFPKEYVRIVDERLEQLNSLVSQQYRATLRQGQDASTASRASEIAARELLLNVRRAMETASDVDRRLDRMLESATASTSLTIDVAPNASCDSGVSSLPCVTLSGYEGRAELRVSLDLSSALGTVEGFADRIQIECSDARSTLPVIAARLGSAGPSYAWFIVYPPKKHVTPTSSVRLDIPIGVGGLCSRILISVIFRTSQGDVVATSIVLMSRAPTLIVAPSNDRRIEWTRFRGPIAPLWPVTLSFIGEPLKSLRLISGTDAVSAGRSVRSEVRSLYPPPGWTQPAYESLVDSMPWDSWLYKKLFLRASDDYSGEREGGRGERLDPAIYEDAFCDTLSRSFQDIWNVDGDVPRAMMSEWTRACREIAYRVADTTLVEKSVSSQSIDIDSPWTGRRSVNVDTIDELVTLADQYQLPERLSVSSGGSEPLLLERHSVAVPVLRLSLGGGYLFQSSKLAMHASLALYMLLGALNASAETWVSVGDLRDAATLTGVFINFDFAVVRGFLWPDSWIAPSVLEVGTGYCFEDDGPCGRFHIGWRIGESSVDGDNVKVGVTGTLSGSGDDKGMSAVGGSIAFDFGVADPSPPAPN